MKRIYYSLVLGLSLLAGCQTIEHLEDPGQHDFISEPEFTVRLEVCKDATKTALTSERSIIWSAEDQLAVFQGHSVADTYQVKPDCVGTSHGNFEIVAQADGEAEAEFQTNVAIYPYQDGLECIPVSENGEVVSYQITGVTIPSVQTYAAGSFPDEAFVMAGLTSKLSDHNLKFKNVCGALKLQLKGSAKIETIELKGNDGELLSGEGAVSIYPDGSVPSITMSKTASDAVTLDCGDGVQLNQETATTFMMALPPAAFEKGFIVTIRDVNGGEAEIETSNSNPVLRSNVLSMPELTVAINQPSADGYKPFVELGAKSTLGAWAKNFYGKQYYRTPRYMRVLDSSVEIKSAIDCDVRVCQYDKDFKFIKIIDFTSVKADVGKEFKLNSSCEYIRLVFRKDSSLPDFELPEVYVENVVNKEYYDIRSADQGYQKILAHIDVDGEIKPDYGVLCLPETYTNTGEPTRLIIFCHGAAVNYPSSVSRFVASDLNPEYWLKEGYAIMDIEGNPFDNTNEHFYIPEAKKCYEEAYRWVTETYNIRKDGVFLGGRSMGGGMCFDILQSSIPVIAACPVVPACNTLWYWNYCAAERKKFCSSKMGFTGTAPTWTSKKKLTDEEYDYLYDNFDKMLECSPIWRGIVDLPSKDELFSVGRVSANTAYDKSEYEFYSKLSYWAKAPVKIFTCYEDTTVPYQRNAQLMYNMMVNAGMECELSLVHTDASTPHRYEQQDSKANIEVTTRFGETLSAPWVYVDMLKFWRKYEQ